MSRNNSNTQNARRSRNIKFKNKLWSKINFGKRFIKLVRKHLHLQHLKTALLTTELLKGSSKHGITTIQNRLDTVNA